MNYHLKVFIAIISVATIAFLIFFNLSETKIALGQNRSADKLVKIPTDKQPKKLSLENADFGRFKAAAATNAALKNSLKWTFGKKNQTGWNLYVPLIQHTINTENDPDSTGFAFALSVWQRENSLVPNGILGAETLSALIKKWQSRRLPKIFEADEKFLFTAPIADFYDPTRDVNLLNVERETYLAYKKMCAAAAKDLNLKFENGRLTGSDNFLKIISAHRSRAYQEQLRKKEPNAGRAQLAFVSPHFTGRALDIYVGGEPVTTKDVNRAIQVNTKAYQWLVKNAERFGFYNYFYEPWHWEYVPENK